MTRASRTLALTAALVATIAVAAMSGGAQAARPAPGASYAGSSEVGEDVRLAVTPRGRALKATVVDLCDGTYVIRGIRIHRGGRFRGEATGPLGATTLEIRGRFASRRRARGTLDGIACPPGERTFRARRQRPGHSVAGR